MDIVEKLKNLKIINTILIGNILKFLPIDKDDLEVSLAEHFKGEVFEINLKAFEEGRDLN